MPEQEPKRFYDPPTDFEFIVHHPEECSNAGGDPATHSMEAHDCEQHTPTETFQSTKG